MLLFFQFTILSFSPACKEILCSAAEANEFLYMIAIEQCNLVSMVGYLIESFSGGSFFVVICFLYFHYYPLSNIFFITQFEDPIQVLWICTAVCVFHIVKLLHQLFFLKLMQNIELFLKIEYCSRPVMNFILVSLYI